VNVRIAPSVLSADFARLGEAIRSLGTEADIIHLDVMDGHFVPNLTIGPAVVRALRKETELPLDCHLMVSEPQRWIESFLEAGANMISIHVEAEPHLERALSLIRSGGALAGIAINPATAAETLADALEYCDFVLAMTVNPGFGGQKFIASVVPKIEKIARMIAERRLRVEIEVDGGVDQSTAQLVSGAGARILVAGSAVFGTDDPAAAIAAIRRATMSLA
jgi:ribulose-phosphate 3-epimerase